jgi:hypothetical protein
MPRGFAMRRLLISLALCLAGAIVGDPGMAQPVGGPVTGGPTTGGNDPGGGNAPGGNDAGGNATGGPTTGGNDPTGGNAPGGNAPGGNTTGGNVNTGGNVGVNVGEERRYTVKLVSFKALDETWCDACGSDEIRFVIRTPDYALFSSLIGNVDENVPQTLERCIQPAVDADIRYNHEWECDERGKAPPFSFTIAAYEDGDDQPLWPFSFCGDNLQVFDERGPDIFRPTATFCIEEYGDFIGKEKVELKLEDLDELREPGQSFLRSIHLIGGCDASERPCSSGGSPDYLVFYEVRRVPDAAGGPAVDPNP